MNKHVAEAEIITQLVDKHWEQSQDDGLRHHLGGSLVGRECMRELWYSFRWAAGPSKHSGRLLRLFDRGHKEEFRFVEYLRSIGTDVRDYATRLCYHDGSDCYVNYEWDEEIPADVDDVSTSQAHIERATARGGDEAPKQWRILDIEGHFGGSLDGIAYNVAGVGDFDLSPDDPVLLEFKTHGQKSFDTLVKDGLQKAKPEHWSQMQVYMTKRGIKLGLYMAVNKNTDELKCFFVPADNMAGAALISKAGEIIGAPQPLGRISTNPSWFKCRFCDFRKQCHMGEPMAKNCRTCAFSKPIEDGKWYCAKWESVIPKEAQKVGCDAHHMITD